MAKQMVLNRKMYKEIKKMDHQDMSNYLSRYYMNAYNQGKVDSEGLKADELREILLTVKGIGPAKAENIKIAGLGIWKIILEGELTNGRKEGMVRSTKIYWRKCTGECSCKSNEERSSVCETGNYPGFTHIWGGLQERG